jgi:glycosyltransferase involved in cell wall biosynthesis
MKLSIITINLNNADGLKQTMESVTEQIFQGYEFIVIDGGSTDGSLDVIHSHADKITRWVSEPDTGIYGAMNKGLCLACGEYVYFLNSGDRLVSPEVLDQIFAKNAYCEDLLYGNTVRPDGANGFREWPQPDELTVACFFRNGICHQSIFYKKELFNILGNYDESFKIAADWEFNIRVLLARRSTRHVPIAVVHYKGSGISETQPDLSSRERSIILKRLLPDAVYKDYMRMQFLEEECRRLKEFEDWIEQIRNRNALVNLAMVTHWFWEKLKSKIAWRKGGGAG